MPSRTTAPLVPDPDDFDTSANVDWAALVSQFVEQWVAGDRTKPDIVRCVRACIQVEEGDNCPHVLSLSTALALLDTENVSTASAMDAATRVRQYIQWLQTSRGQCSRARLQRTMNALDQLEQTEEDDGFIESDGTLSDHASYNDDYEDVSDGDQSNINMNVVLEDLADLEAHEGCGSCIDSNGVRRSTRVRVPRKMFDVTADDASSIDDDVDDDQDDADGWEPADDDDNDGWESADDDDDGAWEPTDDDDDDDDGWEPAYNNNNDVSP